MAEDRLREDRAVERLQRELTPEELEQVKAALERGDRQAAIALHSTTTGTLAWRSWHVLRWYAERLGTPFPETLETPGDDPEWKAATSAQPRRWRLTALAVAGLVAITALAGWLWPERLVGLIIPAAVAGLGAVIALRTHGEDPGRIGTVLVGVVLLFGTLGTLSATASTFFESGLSLYLLCSVLLGFGTAILCELPRPPLRASVDTGGGPLLRLRAARTIARLGMLVYVLAPALTLHWLALALGPDAVPFNSLVRYLLVSWVYGLVIGLVGRPAAQSLGTALEFTLIPAILIAVDSFLFKRMEPFEGLLSLALTTLVAALLAFLVVGWVGVAVRGRSTGPRLIVAVGSMVALPGVLAFGVARFLFEEATQRGVVRLSLWGLAPMVIAVLWVVIEVLRGVRDDATLSAALRGPAGSASSQSRV